MPTMTHDATTVLIIAAAVAWAFQAGFGWLQIRSFNRLVRDLGRRGRISVGRAGRRWQARTLVVLGHGADGAIREAFVFRGMTVMARPVPCPDLVGTQLPLDEARLAGLPKGVAAAIRSIR